MTTMTLTYRLFFGLLKNALFGTEIGVSDTENCNAETLVDVLRIAKKQTVFALVFDAIDKNHLQLPQQAVLQSVVMVEQIRKHHILLNGELKALAELLDTHNIPYVVVKGQVVGTCYSQPHLRQGGDIDIFIPPTHFEEAITTIHQAWNAEMDDGDSDKHIHFLHNHVSFEIHHSLTHFYNKKQDAYWEKILAEDTTSIVTIDGYNIKALSPTLHTLYVFLHLYHHLMELGVGLRQFCDLALIHHRCSLDIDKDRLQQHLQKVGLEKAYRACGHILVCHLGLPADEFPYQLSDKDDAYGTKLLDVVLFRGNMGFYNKKFAGMGWRHNLESFFIKCSHFFKFFPLAPMYSTRWILNQTLRKVRIKMLK